GHVVRYDAVTGATIWDTVTSASYRTVCFTRDDVNVIVSNGPNVTAINFLTGAVSWTRNLGSTVGAPGCAADGSVIVGTSGGSVFALDPILGVNRWVAPALGPVSGAPAFGTAGQVYVSSTNQKVFALDGSSGTTTWSFTTQSQFLNGPVVGHDNSVYLINVNGEIFKLRPDGSQIWSVDLPCNTRGNFSIDPEGTIYVGLSDGLNGLLIVKQVLDDHSPESTLLVRGKNVSGGLPELQSVDGQYFVANPGPVTSQNEFPIQLNCSTTLASDKLDRLTVNITTSVDSPGLIQVISLYNVTIGNYEIVDVRSAPLVDATTSVNVNSPSRFVDSFQKTSTVKISYFPSTFVPTSVWKAKIDAVKWLATPSFAIP
ncbi:MAG: PQQ-binding-like beta-propeller repeat protein, partial [Chthonomonadaceae bacterium]|nr:PQQ-binding-like beta-propeller repeat protein [Chthonomonadaceae bacterium]